VSLWTSIRNTVTGAIKTIAPVAATIAGGPFLGPIAGAVVGGVLNRPVPMSAPSMTPLVGMALPGAGFVAGVGSMGPLGRPVGPGTVPRLPAPRTTPARPVPGPSGTGAPRVKMTPYGTLARYGAKAAAAAGWITIGKYWYDTVSQQIVGIRTSRRMNPLNVHALRRSIRRVKGATRICREVEKITKCRTRGGGSRRGAARASAGASCR